MRRASYSAFDGTDDAARARPQAAARATVRPTVVRPATPSLRPTRVRIHATVHAAPGTAHTCLQQFEKFVGLDHDHSALDVYYLQPNQLGWNGTRGGYTCLVYEPGKTVVGSRSGAAR